MKFKILLLFGFLQLVLFGQHTENYNLVKKARTSYKNGEFDQASKEYDAAFQYLEDYDSIPEQFQSKYRIADYSKAIETYNNISVDRELNTDDNFNLGNAYYMKSDFDNAIEQYKKVIRKNPNDIEARHNLSMALRKKQSQNNQENKDDQDDQNEKKNQNNESDNSDNNQTKEDKEKLNKSKNERILQNLADKELKTKAKLNKSNSNSNTQKRW